jgi:membrane peptidoglycan carboxypeptidase
VKSRLRTVILLLVSVGVAVFVGFSSLQLKQAREALRAGRTDEAIAISQRWRHLGLWRGQFDQVHANATLQRAAALTKSGNIAEAERAFASLDRTHVDQMRYRALQQAIAARKSGSVPYVFDRDGHPIAAWRPATNDVVALDDAFASLISRDAGALTIGSQLQRLGGNDTIETTLDSAVQRAAMSALGKYHGAIVAIDPRTNELLAIASTSGNLALERQYEPGSVIKVLTGLNALTNGVDAKSMFPYQCKGFLEIDGRHFGDWLAAGHGTMKSIDDALAVSCNVYFADVGLRLGRDRLRSFMTAAGFGGQTNLGLFEVPLGKTVGDIFNNFETAFYAIGLEHESINALHLAMLASMMANRGVMTTPRLLRARRSILGGVVAAPPAQGKTRLGSEAAAQTMIEAMQAVANDAKGTGHRAPVEGITLAMKTGTAGERKSGLEALIMAFAPVESPKIAFAVIAEDAGPAEFAGAKIAHDFLEAIKPRLGVRETLH